MLKARMGEAKFKQLMYDHYVEKYGVSPDFLWGSKTVKGLYELRNFKAVADWIIDNNQLTQEQANNIWNGYFNKKCIGQKEKDSNRLRIEKKYNQKVVELHKFQGVQRQEILESQKNRMNKLL